MEMQKRWNKLDFAQGGGFSTYISGLENQPTNLPPWSTI